MTIKSDKWIRRMAEQHGLIEPFEPGQVRQVDGRRVISYGTSSYGYDIRCAPEFKVFTNIHSTVVDPKNFDEKSFVDFHDDVCIIPGVGRLRHAGVLQHHAAAGEDLRGRRLRAGAVLRKRRGVRGELQGPRREVPGAGGGDVAEGLILVIPAKAGIQGIHLSTRAGTSGCGSPGSPPSRG
ncbi:MAG: dcd [Ramlibacter sp.]|nr:dcd [Ramlibacter sp.]